MGRLLVASALLVAVLVGCDNGGFPTGSAQFATGSTPSISSVSAQDAQLLQQMFLLHQQEVRLADVAVDPARQASAQVSRMAGDISVQGNREIAQMAQWMQQWQVPSPSATVSSPVGPMASHTGAAFDRMWLENMMGVEQQIAALSQQIQQDAQSPEMKDMADLMESNDFARMGQMQSMM